MADIREETKLDIRHLLLYFHFLTQAVDDTYRVAYPRDNQQRTNDIQYQCPPRQPPWTMHDDQQLFLVAHIASLMVCGTHMEHIPSVTKMVIGHPSYAFRVSPIRVNTVHLIGIDDLMRPDIIHRSVLNGHTASVFQLDGVAFQQFILCLHTRDSHRRNEGRMAYTRRRECAITVRVTKQDRSVRRTKSLRLRKPSVVFAVQSVVEIQISALQIQLCDVVLGTEPQVLTVSRHTQNDVVEGLYTLDLRLLVLGIKTQQTATERA